MVCHTNDDGPSPNSQCGFPFRQKEEGEEASRTCSFRANPSEADEICTEVGSESVLIAMPTFLEDSRRKTCQFDIASKL